MNRFSIALLGILFALQVQGQTSQEEYNYLTKGYEIALNSGLDLKSGYFFLPEYVAEKGSYTFTFKEFMRSSDSTFAGTSVIAKSSVSGRSYYLCIPFYNAELTRSYETYLYANWDAAITRAYAFALSDYYVVLAVYACEISVKPGLQDKFSEYFKKRYKSRITLD